MAEATFMKSSALFGQNVATHQCRALRISGSPLRNICFVILPSARTLSFPVFYRQPAYSRACRSVRHRDTFIPTADVLEPPEPLHIYTSLFDSVVSALCVDGMKIALISPGKLHLPHQ